MREWIAAIGFSLLVAGCGLASGVGVRPNERDWSDPQLLAKVTDRRLTEASGIAASQRESNVYFTHNDSGAEARLFAFDQTGRVVGEFDVRQAGSVDWEDIASASLDGKPYLFIGDIGDNAGARRSVIVYRVREPRLGEYSATPDRVYRLKYPDEPHNAETLMVHPVSGAIQIVTKAAKRPSMVFGLTNPGRSGTYSLKKLGELQLGNDSIRESRLVTGGAFSPDGKFVVLRTYLKGYEFGNADGRWWNSEPNGFQIYLDWQGEGITYGRDGKGIFTIAEGSPAVVASVRLR